MSTLDLRCLGDLHLVGTEGVWKGWARLLPRWVGELKKTQVLLKHVDTQLEERRIKVWLEPGGCREEYCWAS